MRTHVALRSGRSLPVEHPFPANIGCRHPIACCAMMRATDRPQMVIGLIAGMLLAMPTESAVGPSAYTRF